MIKFNNDWDEKLKSVFDTDKYQSIREFLKIEYSTNIVYPDMHNIFRCFKETSYSNVKAVILGQDPYHEEGQAQGLSFSVPKGVKFPPSLVNIFKELKSDLGYDAPKSGDLSKWASEGVLLLNTTLTVRQGLANSHKDCGWQWFTDEVIKILNERDTPIVFILWGGNARSKKKYINLNKHFVVESAHPSPLSCYNGFWGSKPFSKTNEFLKSVNISPINWNLND